MQASILDASSPSCLILAPNTTKRTRPGRRTTTGVKCPDCGDRAENLRRHHAEWHYPKTDIRFKQDPFFVTIERDVTTQEFPCPRCNKYFRTRNTFKRHAINKCPQNIRRNEEIRQDIPLIQMKRPRGRPRKYPQYPERNLTRPERAEVRYYHARGFQPSELARHMHTDLQTIIAATQNAAEDDLSADEQLRTALLNRVDSDERHVDLTRIDDDDDERFALNLDDSEMIEVDWKLDCDLDASDDMPANDESAEGSDEDDIQFIDDSLREYSSDPPDSTRTSHEDDDSSRPPASFLLPNAEEMNVDDESNTVVVSSSPFPPLSFGSQTARSVTRARTPVASVSAQSPPSHGSSGKDSSSSPLVYALAHDLPHLLPALEKFGLQYTDDLDTLCSFGPHDEWMILREWLQAHSSITTIHWMTLKSAMLNRKTELLDEPPSSAYSPLPSDLSVSPATRSFLDTLRRPLGQHAAAFGGIETEEHLDLLCNMHDDWDMLGDELMKHGLTCFEWLIVRDGLKRRERARF